MTAPTPTAPPVAPAPPVVPAEPQAPAAAVPAAPAPAKRSLEDSLAGLDEDTRAFVLGEVSGARNEAKGLRERVKAAEPKLAEYDKLVTANQTELERAQADATKAAERATALVTRAVKAEVKALAADLFADPSDAVALLDTAKYAKDDGDVDTDAITADLATLLAAKPHLGKPAGTRLPAPNQAQGAGGSGAPGGTQLTREDVERLGREGKHAEIDKAREEGRLNTLLGIQ